MNSEFTCAQCRDALPGFVAGTLARSARHLVECHLDGCDACQHEYAQWRTLADLAHQADAQTPEASAQSTAGTWGAIQARILSESLVSTSTGVHSVNDSRYDSFPPGGTAQVVSPLHKGHSLARRSVTIGATVAALLVVALAVGLFAFHSPGGATAINSGQHPTQPPDAGMVDLSYWGSDALSPTDAWAVGFGRENSEYKGVISHFDGTQWRVDKNAIFAGSTLYGISMDSATDGWAVGSHTLDSNSDASAPFLVHYTLGNWVPQTLNLPGAYLRQVQMFGPDSGWATGQDNNGPIFLHFQHGVWTPTTFAPAQAALTQAASTHAGSPLAYHLPLSPVSAGPKVAAGQAQFLSDTEGWATGRDLTGIAVWHYHKGQWQTALHLPAAPGTDFLGLGVNSSTDVWVLGTAGAGTAFSSAKLAFHPLSALSSGGPLVLLHFDGHVWTQVPADSSAGAPFLGGGTWLAQYGSINRQEWVVGLLVNQGGHWSATTFSKPVNSVFSARKAADGSTLVVAATDETDGSQSLQLLRYANGKWSSV